MRIVAHVSKFYDWEPIPADVKITTADIAAGKVKPSLSGGYLARVTKNLPTQVEIMLPEEQIIAKIIHDKTRAEGGRTLTRSQAIAFYLSENVLPHHAHRSWLTKFELHDTDGPDEEMLLAMLAPHTCPQGADKDVAPNIMPSEVAAHVTAYTENADTADHIAHLGVHFKLKAVS